MSVTKKKTTGKPGRTSSPKDDGRTPGERRELRERLDGINGAIADLESAQDWLGPFTLGGSRTGFTGFNDLWHDIDEIVDKAKELQEPLVEKIEEIDEQAS